METSPLIYPLLAQVALTFALVLALGLMRLRAALQGRVNLGVAKLDNKAWPQRVRQVGNSYGNQFEMPVLFYLLCILLMLEAVSGSLFVILAWGFVATRYVHAFIHVSNNYVPYRFYAFASGNVILLTMWLLFAGSRITT